MAARFALALALSLFPLTFAAQQVVTVGQGLSFLPNTLYSAVGDTVKFQFLTPGHSVAAGSYDKPCTPASNTSFYSGILGTTMTYTITINNTQSIFFYCAVAGHCQAGMVGVINPSGDQTLTGYRSAAGNSVGSTPANVQGGVVASANAASTSAAPSTSPTATSTTGAAASLTSTAKSDALRIGAGSFLGGLTALAAFLGSI
ncbi:hypothetical protein E2P81_ATG11179 [Venturia nashicola]|nr:hypothetical protein E2P81_ATG11179 [Venturia nashicola]